ncbi:bridge-like lipid transfer protein family member 2 [Glandiceps talaboti]
MMWLLTLLLYGIVILFVVIAISRIQAIILSKILSKILKKDISIDYVTLFSLQNVKVNMERCSLVVDSLSLAWRFLNPDQKHLLTLCVGDIRVQTEMRSTCDNEMDSRVSNHESNTSKGFSLRPWMVTLIKWVVQFMSFRMESLNIMLLKAVTSDALVHFTLQDLQANGSNRDDRYLSAEVAANQISCKMLKSTKSTSSDGTCIADFSCTLKLSFGVDLLEKVPTAVQVAIGKPSIELYEGFLQTNFKTTSVISQSEEIPAISSEPVSIKNTQKLNTIMKMLPKSVKVDIVGASAKVSVQSKNRFLCLHLGSISLECDTNSVLPGVKDVLKDIILPSTKLQCIFSDIELTNISPLKLFSLTKLQTDLKLTDSFGQGILLVDSCHVQYLQDEVTFWYQLLDSFLLPWKLTEEQLEMNEIAERLKPKSLLSGLKLPIDLAVNIYHLSASVSQPDIPKFSAVASKVQAEAHIRSEQTLMTLTRYSRGKIHGEQLYCYVGEAAKYSGHFSVSKHLWGTPYAMHLIDINFSSSETSVELEAETQCLHLECSNEILDLTEQILGTFKMLRETALAQSPTPTSPTKRSIKKPRSRNIKFKLKDFNGFVCSSVNECLMLRVDRVAAVSSTTESQGYFEGIHFVRLQKSMKSCDCLPYRQLSQGILNMDKMTWKFQPSKEVSVQITNKCCIEWTPTDHMTIYHSTKEVLEHIRNIKASIPRSPTRENIIAQDSLPNTDKSTSISATIDVHQLRFYYTISRTQRNLIHVDQLEIKKEGETFLLSSPEVVFHFDEHQVIVIEEPCFKKLYNNDNIERDRQSFENLQTKSNTGWGIFFKSLDVTFPYQYDFAANYNQIINIFKWLKVVHKKTKSGKLSSDLLVQIKSVVFKLLDSPFEVKLGDNYELMRDEHRESERRKELLDSKVAELKQAHGELIPAKKIDELYDSLDRKSVDIYMKRSKQLYKTSPIRQTLLTWTINGLEFTAICDESLHGKENIIKQLKDIDNDSPYPSDGIEFTTLWCRMVRGNAREVDLTLRDYPQSIWKMKDWQWWGRLVGAEQSAAPRGKREGVIPLDAPWSDATVQRNMPPLKFYHDLNTDVASFTLSWGYCWENTWAQVNQVMDLLNKPSLDPSLPLPVWDKLRLLLHGRLTMSLDQFTILWHASYDPYNTREMLEWKWKLIYLDWTNAHFLIKGDLDVYVRTASKYDDCRLFHLPNFRLEIDLQWITNGDCNDHHSVMPCAPDKVPEHSDRGHDSYAAFRSQNVDVKMTLDVKGLKKSDSIDMPSCLFYASTMRWLQTFHSILVEVTRPTRRGKYFKTTKPRKILLGRHYRFCEFNAKWPSFRVSYWASFAKQNGVEFNLGPGTFRVRCRRTLTPFNDGLKRRAQASWTIVQCASDIGKSQVYLCTMKQQHLNDQVTLMRRPIDKHDFISVLRLVYCRQQVDQKESVNEEILMSESEQLDSEKDFVHKLVVHDLRGVWTTNNREVAFSLYDQYSKVQLLKHNLSTEALKGVKMDGGASASTPGGQMPRTTRSSSITPSPSSRLESSHGDRMLQQLLSEAATKFVAFSDSEESAGSGEQLYGVAACTTDDIILQNWRIEFVNSQVMLKGCETSGYIIVSAPRAQVLQSQHQPAWRSGKLTSKTTWKGMLDSMQYFATVDQGLSETHKIPWLSVSNIEERSVTSCGNVADMVGSGQSAGGVVSNTVGASSVADKQSTVQLQRMISRCSCQFFYASYGADIDPELATHIEPPDRNSEKDADLLLHKEEAVDSFTLLHHDLNVSTNSSQYAMILDIVNNLLLYVEPKRKEASERLQRMKFQLQLTSIEDERSPLLQIQNAVRSLLSNLRRLEKELYLVNKELDDEPEDQDLLQESIDLEQQLNDCKENLINASEDLKIMVSCFKESQLQKKIQLQPREDGSSSVVRRAEVCFASARWKLTEADGQLGIADLELRQFKYSKVTKNDDYGEHLMELGWISMTNLLPNAIYQDVLSAKDASGKGHLSRQKALRVFCKSKPPVGGICITEHFEVNVVPVKIQLTYRFFKTMMGFFFPGRNIDQESNNDDTHSIKSGHFGIDDDLESTGHGLQRSGSIRSTSSDDSISTSSGSVSTPAKSKKKKMPLPKQSLSRNAIDKMRERAASNMFLYMKIPAVPLCVSYKGEKEKNIEDVHNFNLVLPTIEYHDQTWTWLDLAMALKKDAKQALLSQAIKEKLRIKSRGDDSGLDTSSREDADKAKLLLGAKVQPIEKASSKKALFTKPTKR